MGLFGDGGAASAQEVEKFLQASLRAWLVVGAGVGIVADVRLGRGLSRARFRVGTRMIVIVISRGIGRSFSLRTKFRREFFGEIDSGDLLEAAWGWRESFEFYFLALFHRKDLLQDFGGDWRCNTAA